MRALLSGLTRISGNQIIGFIGILLDRLHAEGPHGLAHQRKLRHKIFRGFRAVGLVERIERLAERILGLIKNDRQMGWFDSSCALADKLQQFGCKNPHRAGRQAIGPVIIFLILTDGLEIGPKHERGTIDQKNMVAGAHGAGIEGHGSGQLIWWTKDFMIMS